MAPLLSELKLLFVTIAGSPNVSTSHLSCPTATFGDYNCFSPLTATAAKRSSDTFDCTLYTLAQRTQRSHSCDCHNSCYCFSYNASTFVYDVFLSNLNVPTKCRIGNLTESQYAEH